MELLVMLGAFGLLAMLAVKFGVDSNDRLQSKEEELACFGMQWPVQRTGTIRRARPGRAARAQRLVRHVLANALLAIAARLSPERPASHAR